MKVGIIGFGKMGMLHAALLNQIDGVEVKSIAEMNFFVRFGAKTLIPNIHYYKDYKKMILNEHLDAVIVCTPTFLHVDIAKFALNENVHVFIEKPLSNNIDSALELLPLLSEKKQTCMVGYNLRFAPTFQTAKRIIESGQLGDIAAVNACAYIADVFAAEKGWRYNPTLSGGGVVADFTVHLLDLLCWYLGDVERLTASTKKLYSLDVEDEACISLFFKSGCEAKIETSWSKEDCRKSFFLIELAGQHGYLNITDQTIELNLKGKEPEEIYYPDVYEGYYIDIAGGNYSNQMLHFVEMCRKGDKSRDTFSDAIHIQAIVDAIYKSAKDEAIATVGVKR